MKKMFRHIKLNDLKLRMIEQANEIIEEYQAQGLRLTLRQLYYQFVSRDLIPNTQKDYKWLGGVISDGRLAGHIDWDAIEDRARQPEIPAEWNSVTAVAEAALSAFRLPRWKDQDYYVELWVEKDALAGVLSPLATEHHIPLMVNRGYSSSSAMYECSKRFAQHCEELRDTDEMEYDEDTGDEVPMKKRVVTRQGIILYLGDHDPSGEDMVRDIRERMLMFLRWPESALHVEKIALTMSQIRRYNPPPNPAKITDSRAAKYIERHGDQSWEVDALPPNVLAEIVRTSMRKLIDADKMSAVIAREKEQKIKLREAMKGLA